MATINFLRFGHNLRRGNHSEQLQQVPLHLKILQNSTSHPHYPPKHLQEHPIRLDFEYAVRGHYARIDISVRIHDRTWRADHQKQAKRRH